MLNILRPIEILKEIEKERNDKFYIAGSGIREYLIADKIKRIRILTSFEALDIAREFMNRCEGYTMIEKEDGSIEIFSDRFVSLIFSKICPQGIISQLSKKIYTVDAVAMTLDDFIDFKPEKLINPHGGLEDINNRILRIVDGENLRQNPIGYLRGIRLMAEHELDIDPETEIFMKEHVHWLEGIRGYEYTKELFRILDQKESSYYINLMDRHIGMLQYIFPEIEPMKNVGECKYHVVDSFTHSVYTLKVLEGVVNANGFFEDHLRTAYEEHTSKCMNSNIKRLSLIKLGAFFHDIGKPAAKFNDDKGRTRFQGHEIVGAEMLMEIGKRLGLSEEDTVTLSRYSALHMFPLVIYKNNDVSGDTLFNMFSQTEDETLDVLLIGYADIVATRKLLNPDEEMGNFKVHVEYIANNYITRYLPLKEMDKIITFEEIKKLVGEHEAMPAYEALRKSIYMGRVPLKRDKIDKFLSNISWR